jgi:hypothetical protein
MDWFVPEECARFTFRDPKPTVEHAPESITRILLTNLHWVITYALWGLYIDVPAALSIVFETALSVITDSPVPPGMTPAK